MLSALRKFRPPKSLVIQAAGASALGMTGDVICQKLVEKSEIWDSKRSLKFGLVIGCIGAPLQFAWFKLLQHKFNNTNKMVNGLKQMLVDQIIAAPLLTASFIFFMQLVNGHSIEGAKHKLRSTFLPVMTKSYMIWPLAQFLNLSVIPFQFRVVFVQFVAIFWNIYLSFKVN